MTALANVVTSLVGVTAMAVGVALLTVYGRSPMAGPALGLVALGRAFHLWRLS